MRTFLLFSLVLHITVAWAQENGLVPISEDRLLVPSPVETEIEIVDGDTLWMGIHEIRLHGIDAVEPKQPCIMTGFPKTFCHTTASNLLRDFSKQEGFRCEIHIKDGESKPWTRYGRYIATCYVGNIDVGQDMVAKGWAYADPNYGGIYLDDQEKAKNQKLGMHVFDHLEPWVWRKKQRGDRCSCE